jgi:hypothetical protein
VVLAVIDEKSLKAEGKWLRKRKKIRRFACASDYAATRQLLET